jgi:predicted nuclease of predicted toxin-antitoxin system
VKLLFDHNISPDLIQRLHDLFPGSNHVYQLNLHEADDPVLWAYARQHEFTIVSKDADMSELSMLRGFPPKLVWLRLGNCRTGDIEALIRANYQSIIQLVEDEERGILSLFGKSLGLIPR